MKSLHLLVLSSILFFSACDEHQQTTCVESDKFVMRGDTCFLVKGITLFTDTIKAENLYTNITDELLCCANQVRHLSLDVDHSTNLEQLKSFKNLQSLYLKGFQKIPKDILALKKLKKLVLEYHKQQNIHIPSGIRSLSNLENLTLDVQVFPKEFLTLTHLKKLKIFNFDRFSQNQQITEWFLQLKKLESIEIQNATHFPLSLSKMPQLRKINIRSTPQDTISIKIKIPSAIENLTYLEELNLENFTADSIPQSLGKLKSLAKLKLPFSKYLPQTLNQLHHLKELSFGSPDKEKIALILTQLRSLETLYLGGNTTLQNPKIRTALKNLNQLTNLYLSGDFVRIPPEIFLIKSLKVLRINRIIHPFRLFEQVNVVNSIEKLDIPFCNIEAISDNIRYFKNLKYLRVTGCNLNEVSPEIGKLQNLEYLDISNNPALTSLPKEIKQLKKLRRINTELNQ